MHLAPGEVVDWHSTETREELLMVLSGRLWLEWETRGRRRTARLEAGTTAHLPSQVRHRVCNRSRARLIYVYVTA